MSRRRGGHCSEVAFDTTVVAGYLDAKSFYKVDGHPQRRRKFINDRPVHPHDARMIRRWRSGTLAGASLTSVGGVLYAFDLHIPDLLAWADDHFLTAVLHGHDHLKEII